MKLSYASSTSDTPLLELTIGDKFDQIVEEFPNNDALIVVHQNIRWTFQELKAEVDACAKALMSCDISKGDRVGIWSP